MSFELRWCIRDDRKSWIFVRDFVNKHAAKDFIRRFWKQKKHFKLVRLPVYVDN